METSFKKLVFDPSRMPPETSNSGSLTLVPKPKCSTEQAAAAARLLLGCYRKGDAADPDTYVAAIAATLAQFPEAVVRKVVNPVTGIPATIAFLPAVAEVRQACQREVDAWPLEGMVLIQQGTPQAIAWEKHRGKPIPWGQSGVWAVEKEYPGDKK